MVYALSLASQARFSEAVAQLHRAQELDPFSILLGKFAAWVHLLARNYAQSVEESRRLLRLEPRFALGRSLLGVALALMGETDEGFRWLDKAIQQRSDCMVWLQVEPWMDQLRADSRYHELVERTGL